MFIANPARKMGSSSIGAARTRFCRAHMPLRWSLENTKKGRGYYKHAGPTDLRAWHHHTGTRAPTSNADNKLGDPKSHLPEFV